MKERAHPTSAEARSRRRSGQKAEALAESFLVRQGYLPLARNHVVRGGEVDLVVAQGAVVVFVEVKRRRKGAAVDALASVTQAKQRRIVRAAFDYVRRARLEERPLRFDVVGLSLLPKGEPQFVHVEGAFDASVAGERGRET